MQKSVSESNKLTKTQVTLATNKVMIIATKEIQYVFDTYILKSENISELTIHAIIKKLGTDNFDYAGCGYVFKDNNDSPFKYRNSINNIVKILDIILQQPDITREARTLTQFSGKIQTSAPQPTNYFYWRKPDNPIYSLHKLIEYLISLVSDEYHIECKKIYTTHNQRLIRAIKEINDNNLDCILADLSVSGDLKQGLKELYDFCYKKRNLINGCLPKHKVTAKDNNGKKIDNATIETWHFFSNFLNVETKIRDLHDDTGREPTHKELLTFFDFGLSLARLVKIWENKI